MHNKMKPSKFWVVFIALALSALSVSPLSAAANGQLFGISSNSSGGENLLIEIDTATGAASSVGPIGIDGFVGLTANPTTGQLFGYSLFSGDLVEIDPSTGEGTAVEALASPFGTGINGLAFDWASGSLLASDIGELITIDPATGQANSIGQIIVDGNAILGALGLAFDSTSNTLFGLNSGLIAIDVATGIGTSVGSSSTAGLASLAFDPISSSLFSVDTINGTLIRIDSSTGNAVQVGPLGIDRVFSLAFVPVPEPSSLGMLAAFSVAILSLDRKRRIGS